VWLVAALSAAQLLPFLELLSHSHRNLEFSHDAEWAMPLSGLGNFLVPVLHCYEGPHGVFVQHNQYWVSSYYTGASAFALAVVGVCVARNRRAWLLLGVAVFCVWMAMGSSGIIYPLVKKVMPLLGLMRYPIKFIVLPVFILPLFAAFGVAWLQNQSRSGQNARAAKIMGGIALGLLALMAIIVLMAWQFPQAEDNFSMTVHCAIGRALFMIAAILALAFANRVPRRNLQLLLRASLLALLWMDVYHSVPNLSPTVQRAVYQPGLARKQLKLPPQPQPGEPRFMETTAVVEKMHVVSVPDPVADYFGRRIALYDNCNLLDGIPKLDGLYSLYVRETVAALSMADQADQENPAAAGLKDFLGVAHISAPQVDRSNPLIGWNGTPGCRWSRAGRSRCSPPT
jgi:hypothetical protein